jgi:hypothetical protein
MLVVVDDDDRENEGDLTARSSGLSGMSHRRPRSMKWASARRFFSDLGLEGFGIEVVEQVPIG